MKKEYNRTKSVIIVLIVMVVVSLGAVFLFQSKDQSSTNLKTIYVNCTTVPCMGVGPQRCMQIKENPTDKYMLFYDQIIGFTHTPGIESQLVVREVENPHKNAADTSTILWELVETVESKEVMYIYIEKPQDFEQLDTTKPITVRGRGRGFFEGNLVVQALDNDQNVLGQKITTVTTENLDDEANWRIGLTIDPTQQEGFIRAYSPSPADSSGDIAYEIWTSITASENTTDKGASKLENKNWILDTYLDAEKNEMKATGTAPITAIFSGEEVSGSGGCNQYFGSYVASEIGAISFGPIGSTRKACPAPIMNTEIAYFAGLETSTQYVIDTTTLILSDANGNSVLTYSITKSELIDE